MKRRPTLRNVLNGAEGIARDLAEYAASGDGRAVTNVSEPWGHDEECWQFKLTMADGKEFDVAVRVRD